MTSLMTWTSSYGAYLQFYLQLLFWVVLGAAALWAAVSFSRYVKFMTGAVEEAQAESAAVPAYVAPSAAAEGISVDQFVD